MPNLIRVDITMSHSQMPQPEINVQDIFANGDLEYTVVRTPSLTLHRIRLHQTTAENIEHYYQQFHIDQPPQVAKASLKRQCEFFIGRLAAKFSLLGLGEYSSFIIHKDHKGAPIWPPHITGSISHSMLSHGCGVAIATSLFNPATKGAPAASHPDQPRPMAKVMGIDIETTQHIDIFNNNPSMLHSLLSQQEYKFLKNVFKKMPEIYLILFSAKESLTKALYNKYQQLLYFKAMHCIAICPYTQTLTFYIPQLVAEQKIKVHFLRFEHEVLTFCCLES